VISVTYLPDVAKAIAVKSNKYKHVKFRKVVDFWFKNDTQHKCNNILKKLLLLLLLLCGLKTR